MVLIKGKKGKLAEMVFLPAVVIFLTLLITICGVILYKVNEFAQSDDSTLQIQKDFIDDYYTKYTRTFDFGFTFIYMAIVMGIIVSAYFQKSNPLFFVGGFLVWILSWFITPFVANISLSILNGLDETAVVGSSFTLMNFIYQNFVIINLVIGACILLALYSKRSPDDLGSVTGNGGGDAFE